jgi:hypothetical protein
MSLRFSYTPRFVGVALNATKQALSMVRNAAVFRKHFSLAATRDPLDLAARDATGSFVSGGTTPIFRISHQSTTVGGTTYPIEYGTGLGSSANMTPDTDYLGAKNGTNLWNWSHQTRDGYAGRNYMRYDRWEDEDAGPFTGFEFSPSVVAPAGGWQALAQSSTIYARFRIRVNAPFTRASGASQMKWFIFGGPGLAQGERRMIMSFERPGQFGGTDATHFGIKCTAGVSGNYAIAFIPINAWTHVQLAWRYSDAGTPFLRIYVDNNVEGSPDEEHTAFTADSMGGTWTAADSWTGCNWGNHSADNALTETDAQIDIMDFEVDDAFDSSWAP